MSQGKTKTKQNKKTKKKKCHKEGCHYVPDEYKWSMFSFTWEIIFVLPMRENLKEDVALEYVL